MDDLKTLVQEFMDSLEFYVSWTDEAKDAYPYAFKRSKMDVESRLLLLLQHRSDDGK